MPPGPGRPVDITITRATAVAKSQLWRLNVLFLRSYKTLNDCCTNSPLGPHVFTSSTAVKLYDLLHRPSRFHPDNIQEFLAKRKRKSEGWKCAVRTCFSRILEYSSHFVDEV